jgi:hypothetical protein
LLWQVVLRFLLRIRKGKKRFIREEKVDDVSPGTTAVMSGEDCSIIWNRMPSCRQRRRLRVRCSTRSHLWHERTPHVRWRRQNTRYRFTWVDLETTASHFIAGKDGWVVLEATVERTTERVSSRWNNSNTEEDEDNSICGHSTFSISTNREVSAFSALPKPNQATLLRQLHLMTRHPIDDNDKTECR